ncbi:hypothetical protein AQUCO_09900007v1 [Aquilegia coerulea]|uniref:BED-type domain-containing protein n=1 Tax=Aquilegia coerulea TaxID=218851 RepID=A0A2G5C4D3_AQUCA|nr:hypothetical protein AQUCO_09900007v1 [Aquilegia coerulea]
MCKDLLAFGGTSGTSHLRRHMERCTNKNSSAVSEPIVGRTPNGGVYYFTFSQVVARRETVRYFVQEDVPFNKIGKPSFRRWIRNSFGPQFNPPCRNTLKNDVIKVFNEEQVGLKELFKSIPGKVSYI